MSVTALESLLERRFHGAAVHGAPVAALRGWAAGIPDVDRALGPTGIPRGRITELFGEASCGKTTLAYALLAACTEQGDLGAFVDPHNTLYAPAAAAARIDLARIIVVRPREEQALLRAIDAIVRSGACAVVVLDGSSADVLQTHHYARLATHADRTGTTLVVLSRGGSQALASFASLRLHLHGMGALWQEGDDGGARLRGYRIALEVAKSKIGAPGKQATFDVQIPEAAVSWPAPAPCQRTDEMDRETDHAASA